MKERYVFTSLTRIADLEERRFEIQRLKREHWEAGDYVLSQVYQKPSSRLGIELRNGRMVEAFEGDLLVGALGIRHATVEATGSYLEVGPDGHMHLMTAAGLMGRITSKSIHVPELLALNYVGHLMREGRKLNMKDFVPETEDREFMLPTVITIGTSMSSGKTTAAKIIIRQLSKAGVKVLGAKVTGAGRYRDILSMGDAGAISIYDFVDVGMPSTICAPDQYRKSLKKLLSMMASSGAEIAVIEIGASPLEPYNGDMAFNTIKHLVKCVILCASDPYAVLGVMKAFDLKPDVVSGVAANTRGGIDLVQKLCGLRAINIIDPDTLPELNRIVFEKLGLLDKVDSI